MVFILLKIFLMALFRIFNFFSMIFVERMCVVALAHATMIISGSTFHILLVLLSIND